MSKFPETDITVYGNQDLKNKPRRDCLVTSVSASRAVGCGFESRPGFTKDHHKMVGYKLHPCMAHRRKGRSFTVQPDCLKGRVVCETVKGDMHLWSIPRVGYCILVPDKYLVAEKAL